MGVFILKKFNKVCTYDLDTFLLHLFYFSIFLKNKLTVGRKGELNLIVIFGGLLWLCQDFSTPTPVTCVVVAVLCSTECCLASLTSTH